MSIIASHCRYAQRAAATCGCTVEILDSGEGYLFRISDGVRSFDVGAGPLATYPMNSAFGASVARDKGFTNRILELAGIPNLGGRPFFFSTEGEKLRGRGYELDDAREYFHSLGSVTFCKPLTGSRGDLAELIESAAELEEYFRRCALHYPSFIMQRFFEGEELRIFVFDGEPIFCLAKMPPTLRGDGLRTAAALLEDLNATLAGTALSTHRPVLVTAGGARVAPDYIPPCGEQLRLRGRKNVGFGGDISLVDPSRAQVDLAARAAGALGLRVAAVDLMKVAGGNAADIRVIEVNSNPEIHSLERLGRWDLIERIWRNIIDTCLR